MTAVAELRNPNVLAAASGRLMPQSLDAEQAVLGSVMLDNAALIDLPPGFNVDDFYFEPHKRLFRAMLALSAARKPIDLVTVTDWIRANLGDVAAPEDTGYFAGLTQIVPTAANIVHYAEIVIERSRRRRLIHLANAIVASTFDESIPLTATEAELDRGLTELGASAKAEVVWMSEVAADFRREIINGKIGAGAVELKTGLGLVDEIANIMPGELWLIGGRPANGKSVLALQALVEIAKRGETGMFVGLEMRTLELFRRILRAQSSLRRETVVRPPTDDDFARAMQAAGQVDGLPIAFAKNPDVEVICREATRVHRRQKDKDGKGLRVLVVDYLQRCRRASARMVSRDVEIGDIAQCLKDWSDKNEIPVLGLVAVNRESVKRQDPRPGLSDLRESGRLEFEASGVIFAHRPSLIAGTPESKAPKDSPPNRKVELLLAKNRDGEACVIRTVQHEFEHMRFAFPLPEGEAEV